VATRVARFCTAQVLDAEVEGDRPYIVSEYVPGPSLHTAVQEGGPRSGGALERLAVSTLTALAAIHQAGIMHRDFKPHNIVLAPDGPRVWAQIERKDGTKAADRGAYAYYAGPVFVSAKGQCVRYTGGTGQGSAGGPWGNCG
jgi:serine/threonine protein kinase